MSVTREGGKTSSDEATIRAVLDPYLHQRTLTALDRLVAEARMAESNQSLMEGYRTEAIISEQRVMVAERERDRLRLLLEGDQFEIGERWDADVARAEAAERERDEARKELEAGGRSRARETVTASETMELLNAAVEPARKGRQRLSDAADMYAFALHVEVELLPELVSLRAREAELTAALAAVADAFTAWSEDHNDGTYAYYKSDDLMVACVAARAVLADRPPRGQSEQDLGGGRAASESVKGGEGA